MEEFLKSVDVLESHSQESRLKWYQQTGVVTMYSQIFEESVEVSNSLYNDDELAARFVTVDPIDGELMPSRNAMITTYKLLSPQGMVVLGDHIVHLSANLQAWAPLSEKEAFIEAIRQYDVSALERYNVTFISDNFGPLAPRGSVTIVPPSCPWLLSNGSERSDEETNERSDGRRKIRTSWSIAKIIDPENNSVSYRMGVYMKSFKKTFGYKTVHDWKFDIRFLRDGAVSSTFLGSWEDYFKSDSHSEAIEDVTYASATNLSRVNISISEFNWQNLSFTEHHHRGMGEEYNYLNCE